MSDHVHTVFAAVATSHACMGAYKVLPSLPFLNSSNRSQRDSVIARASEFLTTPQTDALRLLYDAFKQLAALFECLGEDSYMSDRI